MSGIIPSGYFAGIGQAAGSDATGGAGLFGLAESKLAWIDTRQKQLAQNIANADTPGYKPRDLKPFSALVDQFSIAPALTSPLDIVPPPSSMPGSRAMQSETAPDGNAVSIEQEMTKVAQDETQGQLVSNIWKTYMGMFMTALGKSG